MTGGSDFEYVLEDKVAPIVIKATRNAPIKDPGLKILTYVGSYALEHYLEHRKEKRFEPENDTILTVRQQIDGADQVTVFRIDSERKLRIEMNGKFIQDVERGKIDIAVDPEVDSVILITDFHDEDEIAVHGDFLVSPYPWPGPTHIDLDTGRTTNDRDDTVDFRSGGLTRGGLHGVNGALVARWEDGQPSRTACSELPPGQWKEKTDYTMSLSVTYCIVTNEGRYGFVRIASPNSYVVWEHPEGK
ncbi:hypothetical protein FNQ90_02980 [Streptomyces alkaliphilus]|uniref:Uncharacterized protein n=1 Tax=Streptomyces alkaliphilus TaxID=1472722 RepID=A0A7W3Y004_9ACTN|nr:hypothetical protein [Streptomyces alkaliphilus]MBB0243099.1 hypothetical protein [Streptomyces alkaliphilus]